MSKYKIAVIGAGSTGLASAIFLNQLGHQVEIFEKALKIKPVGAGLLLQPTGLAVLKKIVCLDSILENGQIVDQLTAINHREQRILDLDYKKIHSKIFGCGIHRANLLSPLLKRIVQEKITLNLDQNISELEKLKKQFDLVIICNGASSNLRNYFKNLIKLEQEYPWGALWFIGNGEAKNYSGTLLQRTHGTRLMQGILPTGLDPKHFHMKQSSLFYSLQISDHSIWKNTDLLAWKEKALKVMPECKFLVDQIHSHEDLQLARYHDVVLKKWHLENIIILGDAAHATSPQLGQGANLGLMDAWVLSECIKGALSLQEAMCEYTKRRKKILTYYQFCSRWLTPFFQSHHNYLATLRDLGFKSFKKIPWVSKQMLLTMAGLKKNLFFSKGHEDQEELLKYFLEEH